MVDNIKFRLEQFEKFYHFLTKSAPEGYTPWFFPCEPSGKNPCPLAILKINRDSKGSWHHESARLTKEQCLQHIRDGFNLGISARKEDALIIGDIDNPQYLNQVPEDTLTTISRKRVGLHFFGWNKDGTAKINLPTDNGEMRSENQYVLAPGSYVPFNLQDKKDKKVFDELPAEAREDELIGYYTVGEATSPKELIFNDLPLFFKEKEIENIEAETKIKQTEERKEFKGEGKYTSLFNLKVSDIVGSLSKSKRVGHPLHESETDANFSLSSDGTLGHCWRHMVSLNAVQFLCVQAGYSKCEDAGTPHKGRGFSKIKGDKKAFEVAYEQAKQQGFIKEKVFSIENQVENFNDIQPLFYDRAGLWWLWNKNLFKWEIVDDVDILNMITEATGKDVISSKSRTEIINALKQKGRLHIPKNIKKSWIQFKDTIVDYKTGEEFKASPEWFVTNPIPYELHRERFIETPIMDKIFEEWVGKDYVQTLYEIIAYSLIPDYPIHRLFCFVGGGMNGKSCFLRLLEKFVGKENITATELDTLIMSRFEITKLHKKLVCVMGETNFTEISKTSIIKKLTGQDTIGFEYKNKNPFDDTNYAKIIIATNNLPSTTDKTIGFYRRWCIIDFPNKFSEQKNILDDIPEEEYEILGVKCLSILNDLIKNKTFHKEGSIEERTEKYESKSNFLDKFLNLFVEEDTNGYITKNDFIIKFIGWCKENRHREMSDTTIGLEMKKKEFESGKKYFSWLYDGKGGDARVWLGVKWKE